MMEIIATLPSRQREAIILHYYGGLSVTEVAAAMSIPHQSVSLYLKLARKKMREELLRRREQSEQPERCQRAKQPEQSRRSEQDEKPNPPKNIKLGTASTAPTESLVRSRLPYLAVDQQTNPLTSVSTAYLLWQRPWCAPLTSRSLLNSISTKTFRSY